MPRSSWINSAESTVFFSRSQREEPAQHALEVAVRSAMPEADEATLQIVVACAGLLGTTAYADRDFSAEERQRVDELLQSIQGLDETGRREIIAALEANIVDLATVHSTRFTRALKEHADRDLRRHVLDLLVDVAAADDEITHSEVTVLRRLTEALGLEQADYNEAQEKHRDKLAAISKRQ